MAEVETVDRIVRSVELPSRGLLYEGKLPDGRIDISPMTTADEKLMAGPGDKSTLTDVLLKRAIVTQSVPYESLLVGDKLFLLLFLRGITYGFDYEFKMPCSKCSATFRTTLKIPEGFRIKQLTEEDIGPYEVKLPVSQKTVELRLLRVQDEMDVQKFVKRQAGKVISGDGDPAYVPRLAKSIVSIGGKKADFLESLRFVEGLYGGDSLEIRNTLDSHDCGVDLLMEFSCSSCGSTFEEVMPFTAEFFRPKPQRLL